MLETLINIMNQKLYCELRMTGGNAYVGYITDVNEFTFTIVSLEPMIPEIYQEQVNEMEIDEEEFEEMGGIIEVEIPEEEVNYIPVKNTEYTALVTGVTHDVSHRISSKLLPSILFMRDNTIYPKEIKPITRKRKKVAKG